MAVVRALSLLKDGGLVAVGNLSGLFYIKNLKSDGSFNESFGNQGIVIDGSATDAMAVAVQKDGKIIATGYGYDSSSVALRYNKDGSKDLDFGNQGEARLIVDGFDSVKDLQILSDGKILLAFQKWSWEWGSGVLPIAGVARLNKDGSLDDSFGEDGLVKIFGSYPASWSFVRTQTDGKILLSATTTAGNGWDVFTVRLNKNGTVDSTYGDSGYVYVSHSDTQHARSLNIDKANNSYIAGSTQIASQNPFTISFPEDYQHDRDFFITKVNSRGQLDSAFGFDGKVSVDFGGQDTCQASTIQ